MKKKWYLRRLYAVGLLIFALALLGCSGDDGDMGPQGPPGPSPAELARGVDSPNASLCYSCHQHDGVGFLPDNVLRAHMDNMGGEMFGGSAHGEEPPESCVTCHGGFRPGGGRPDGLSDELHAGFQHQVNRTPGIWDSRVDDVNVAGGEVEVAFTIEDARAADAPDEVNVEITLAKELPDGSWMSMLHRTRDRDDGIKVIRSGNLRLEDADLLTGGVSVDDGMQFSIFLLAADGDYEDSVTDSLVIDFSNGAVWRRAGDDDASTYNGGFEYRAWVKSKIDDINENGTWGAGIYRISITGRDRGSDYVRFAAVADFELTGSGDGATVVDGSIGAPRPTNQIEQASCNTCHGKGGYSFSTRLDADHPTAQGYDCASCHGDDAGFTLTPDAYHGVSARLEELRIQREYLAFKLVGVEDAVYGAIPLVRWQVLKWQQNDNGNSAFEPLELTEEMIYGGPRLHIG